jgi:hypothetical protein
VLCIQPCLLEDVVPGRRTAAIAKTVRVTHSVDQVLFSTPCRHFTHHTCEIGAHREDAAGGQALRCRVHFTRVSKHNSLCLFWCTGSGLVPEPSVISSPLYIRYEGKINMCGVLDLSAGLHIRQDSIEKSLDHTGLPDEGGRRCRIAHRPGQ